MTLEKGYNQKEKGVSDSLRVCNLNLLPEVITLPSLVTINLVILEIYFFQFAM